MFRIICIFIFPFAVLYELLKTQSDNRRNEYVVY